MYLHFTKIKIHPHKQTNTLKTQQQLSPAVVKSQHLRQEVPANRSDREEPPKQRLRKWAHGDQTRGRRAPTGETWHHPAIYLTVSALSLQMCSLLKEAPFTLCAARKSFISAAFNGCPLTQRRENLQENHCMSFLLKEMSEELFKNQLR